MLDEQTKPENHFPGSQQVSNADSHQLGARIHSQGGEQDSGCLTAELQHLLPTITASLIRGPSALTRWGPSWGAGTLHLTHQGSSEQVATHCAEPGKKTPCGPLSNLCQAMLKHQAPLPSSVASIALSYDYADGCRSTTLKVHSLHIESILHSALLVLQPWCPAGVAACDGVVPQAAAADRRRNEEVPEPTL